MIVSPVTGSRNVSLLETLDVKEIIQAYSLINLDVSSYFDNVSTIHLYLCVETGYRFFSPSSLSADSKFYDLLNKKNWYYGIRHEHKRAARYLPLQSNLLEVGSGNGDFLQYVSSLTKSSLGLETNFSAACVSRERGIHTQVSDIYDYAINSKSGDFDVVCGFQVLEHVHDVRRFIESALRLLKPGGLLIIGVPNNNPYLYKYDKYHALNLPPHHMGLWSIESLRALADHFPLQIVDISAERLSPYELVNYYKIQRAHAASSLKIIKYLFYQGLISIRPFGLRSRIMNFTSRQHDGRNILAVYSRLSN